MGYKDSKRNPYQISLDLTVDEIEKFADICGYKLGDRPVMHLDSTIGILIPEGQGGGYLWIDYGPVYNLGEAVDGLRGFCHKHNLKWHLEDGIEPDGTHVNICVIKSANGDVLLTQKASVSMGCGYIVVAVLEVFDKFISDGNYVPKNTIPYDKGYEKYLVTTKETIINTFEIKAANPNLAAYNAEFDGRRFGRKFNIKSGNSSFAVESVILAPMPGTENKE